jgi:uncharacterized protein DUF2796
MPRSTLFLSASLLILAACQPASEAPVDLVADTPPPVVDPVMDEAASVSDEMVGSVEVAAAADAEAHEHDGGAGEQDDDHENHADEDDGDDAHGHEEHAHDEDDHDHAGGEAHVHGLSELAVSLDGATVSISLEGALANFDLDESLKTLEDSAPYTDTVLMLGGGDCVRDQASAEIRPIGDHGNLMIDLSYTCAAPAELTTLTVTAFEQFSGFEEVNAVILTDTRQTAKTLTSSDNRLDLP